MSDLIERIQELEEAERKYNELKLAISEHLGYFVAAWDSNDPDRLPANKKAMINPVRNILNRI